MTAVALGTNGDFDAGIGDWQAWVGAFSSNTSSTVAHDAGFSHGGAGSLLHTCVAGDVFSSIAASTPWPADTGADEPPGTMVPIPSAGPGTLSVSAWYYTTDVSFPSVSAAAYLIADDDSIVAFAFEVAAAVYGAWTMLSGTGTVPGGLGATVNRAVLFMRAGDITGPGSPGPDVGAEIWWDDFTLDIPPLAAAGWVVG